MLFNIIHDNRRNDDHSNYSIVKRQWLAVARHPRVHAPYARGECQRHHKCRNNRQLKGELGEKGKKKEGKEGNV